MSSSLPFPSAILARQHLLEQALSRSESFQVLLTRYGLEHLLYRLAQRPYRERFVLKGARLVAYIRGLIDEGRQ